MASSVDDRVVAMKFDNNAFDSKVAGTISVLDKLKQSLDFKSSSKGLEDLSNSTKGFHLNGIGAAVDQSRAAIQNLSKSAGDINLEGIGSAVENISSKFSAMGAVAFGVITNITNRVVDLGIQIGKSLTITPINDGFKEYETNIGSIQTILANTKSKGTGLPEVTAALDKLNTYSDQTIYNFSQMASSIGRFTAAGNGLDESVSAIKGIANLSALTGTSAEAMANVSVQLSQALNAGKLSAVDWMSVTAAGGISGEAFQSSLFETAKALKTLTNVPVDQTFVQWKAAGGNFKKIMEQGVFTSDVLALSLQSFSGELSEATLISKGFTEQQARQIVETAKLAQESATDVKTFTQLVGTIKEAVGTGWADSFKFLIGGIDEAKQLFSGMYTIASSLIGAISKGRNETLKFWHDNGGREAIIQSLRNVMWSLASVIGTIHKAWRDAFPKHTGENITRFSKFIEKLTHALIPSAETMEKVGRIFTGIFSIFALGWSVIKVVARAFGSLLKVFGLFSGVAGGGAGGVLEILAKIGDAITWLKKVLVDDNFLGKFFDGLVQPLIDFVRQIDIGKITEPFVNGFNRLKDFLSDKFDIDFSWFDKIKDAFNKLRGLSPDQAMEVIKDGFNRLKELIPAKFNELREALGLGHAYLNFDKLGADIKAGLQRIHDIFFKINFGEIPGSLGHTFDKIEATLEKFKNSIAKLFGRGEKSDFENAVDGLSNPVSTLEELTGRLQKRWETLVDVGKKVIDFFKMLGEKIKTGINEAFGSIGGLFSALTEGFKTGNFQPILDALNVGLFSGILLLIKKFLDGGVGKLIAGDLFDKIGRSFDALTGHLKAMTVSIKADALFTIAKAIALLAASLLVLSLIDSDALARALGAMAVGFGALVLTMKQLDKIAGDPRNVAQISALSVGLVALAAAVLILSFAVKKLGDLSTEELVKGLISVGLLLGAIAFAVKTMQSGKDTKDADMIKVGLGMFFMAKGIDKLAKAVETFGNLDLVQLVQGLAGVAASMAILVLTMKHLPEDLPLKGASLLGLAFGLIILSKAVEAFGNMDLGNLVQGLGGVAVAMLILTESFRLMPNKKHMADVGVNLLLAAAAVFILQRSVANFGDMDFDKMKNGLLGVGASLLLLAVACNAMNGAMIGATAIGVAAVSLIVMAKAVELFSNLGFTNVLIGLAGIAAAFLVIGAAGALLSLVAPAITAAGAALIALGGGMLAVGLGAALFGAGLYLIGTSLREFSGEFENAVTRFLGLIPEFVKGIATFLKDLASAFLDGLPDMVGKFGKIFGAILDLLETYAPRIVKFVIDLITTLSKAIGDNSEVLVKAGFDLLMAFLRGLAEHTGEITTLGLTILGDFLKSLAENIGPVIEAGGNLILNFLSGMIAKLPLIVAQGSKLITDFLIELEKGIGPIADALGKLIATGITKIAEQVKPISDALTTLLVNILTEAGKSVLTLSGPLSTLLVNVLTEAGKAVTTLSGPLTTILVNTITEAAKTVTALSGPLTTFLVNIITEVAKAVKPISDAFSTLFVNILTEAAKTVTTLSGPLTTLLVTIITEAAKAIKPISDALNALLVKVITEAANTVTTLSGPFTTLLANIITEVGKAVTKLSGPLTTVLVNVLTEIGKSILPIQNAMGSLLVKALQGVAENVQRLQDVVIDIFIKMIKSAGENASRVTNAITDMFVSFVKTVSGSAARLVNAGFDIIIDFMNSLADTIRQKSSQLEDAGKNLAGAILDGLTHGLASRAGDALNAATSFMGPVVGALFGAVKAKSPSKLMIELAGHIADGLVIGFSKNTSAVNAASVFGDGVAGRINQSLSNVSSILENMGEFNPTITPVIDMTNVERSAAQMTALMNSPKFDASVSFDQAASLAAATRQQTTSMEDESSSNSVEVKEISYTQINNAPKALSTNDIYRQTKAHLSIAKGELKI